MRLFIMLSMLEVEVSNKNIGLSSIFLQKIFNDIRYQGCLACSYTRQPMVL